MLNIFLKITRIKILTILLLIIFELIFIIPSIAAEQVELTVDLPESVNIGNSFDVKVASKSNSYVKAISMNVSYDSNYISYKGITNVQSCEIDTFESDGKIATILLFDNYLISGDVFTLTFTAKTGNSSSRRNFSFEVLEAVDVNLNNASVKIPNSLQINIVKKGEQNSNDNKDSSFQGSASSRLSSSKSNSRSSSLASNSNSTRSTVESNVSKTYSSSYFENDEVFEGNIDVENNVNSKNTEASIAQLDDGEAVGSLNLSENSSTYIFMGVGITLSIIGILFVVYRMGQLSRRKPEADKIFPKNDNEDKW